MDRITIAAAVKKLESTRDKKGHHAGIGPDGSYVLRMSDTGIHSGVLKPAQRVRYQSSPCFFLLTLSNASRKAFERLSADDAARTTSVNSVYSPGRSSSGRLTMGRPSES